MKKIVMLGAGIAVCVIISCGSSVDSGYEPDEIADYLLTFKSTWSSQTHPTDFPSNPQFSGLIGAVHKGNVIIWREGGSASAGIQEVAETGGKTMLSTEIDPLIYSGDAYVKLSGDGISRSPGTMTIRFTIHRDSNHITLLSKISPGPDWFVGVSDLSLFENDDWIIEKKIELYPYDAGTDSGEKYTADDQPTEPRGKITKITGYPFSGNGAVLPLGTFTFKRL